MSSSKTIPNQNQTDHHQPSNSSNHNQYPPQPQPQPSSEVSFQDYSTFHNQVQQSRTNSNYLDSYLDSTTTSNTINQTFKPFQFQSQSSTEPLIFDPLTFDQLSTLFPNFNSSSSSSSQTSNLQSTLSDSHQFSTDQQQLSINPHLLSPKLITNQSDHYSNQTYPSSNLIQSNHQSRSPSDSNHHQNQSSSLQIPNKNQTHSPLLQSSPEPPPPPPHLIQSRKPLNDGLPDPKRKRTEESSKPNSIITDGSYNRFLEPSPMISSTSSHQHSNPNPNQMDFRNQECSTPKVNSLGFESNSIHQNQTPSEQAGSNLSLHQYRSQFHYQHTSDHETPNQSRQYRSSIDQSSSPNLKANSSSQSIQVHHPHHHLTHDFTKRKDWAKKVMEDVMDLCLLIGSTDQRIKFVSSSLNQLTGYQQEDWMESWLIDWCFDEDDRINFLREIENCTQNGNGNGNGSGKEIGFYCRIRKKDGSCLILEICGHPVLIENQIDQTNLIFISGRKYPSSSSQLSDRIFDLRLENQRLLTDLKLLNTHDHQDEGFNSSKMMMMDKPKERVSSSDDQKSKKTQKVGKKSSLVKFNANSNSNPSFGTGGGGTGGKVHGSKVLNGGLENETGGSEFVCKDCGTTISPEWRKGPTGPKTLCNACGLRWAKKAKPVNS